MTEVVLSRRAREDLERSWLYIAMDSETSADRTLMAIDAKIRRLETFPESGAPRDDVRPGARVIVHRPYLILHEYNAALGIVEIVAVVEGMRDLDRLF